MTDLRKELEERIASELCEARYWLHPDSEHHDVQTCDSCKAWAREQVAAVRAHERARCREILRTTRGATWPEVLARVFAALDALEGKQ